MSCTMEELRNICLWPSGIQEYPTKDMDEVWPCLFLGNARSASNLDELKRRGVAFVLNSAHGHDFGLNLLEVHSPEVYQSAGIEFLGIPALDMMSYSLDQHFEESSAFIGRALRAGKGVLVHCKMGISRSAALVIAYLVMEEGLEVRAATREVRCKREIFPNDGFLLQLCKLDKSIHGNKQDSDCDSTVADK